jgi:hypothetical protein
MEIGESVAPPGLAQTNSDDSKLVGCDWQDCLSNHAQKVPYPGGGKLDRSSGFAAAWVSAGLEPWVKYGDGIDSMPSAADYRAETKGASYVSTAAAMKFPEYHTQKHHLISINLFKNVAKLKHNATLISYDVNAPANGVCLPSFTLDIVRHDLQAHRGSHPNNLYNSKIQPLLEDLEQRSAKYCEPDREGECELQKQLLGDLDRLSRKVEARIHAWDWLLRSDALAERSDAYARLERLRAANE